MKYRKVVVNSFQYNGAEVKLVSPPTQAQPYWTIWLHDGHVIQAEGKVTVIMMPSQESDQPCDGL